MMNCDTSFKRLFEKREFLRNHRAEWVVLSRKLRRFNHFAKDLENKIVVGERLFEQRTNELKCLRQVRRDTRKEYCRLIPRVMEIEVLLQELNSKIEDNEAELQRIEVTKRKLGKYNTVSSERT